MKKSKPQSVWTRETILRAIIISVVFFGFVFFLFGITNNPKTPATIEQVETVLKEQGYTPIDTTQIFKEQMGEVTGAGLTASVGIQTDDIEFVFFVFNRDENAEAVRKSYQSWIWQNRFSTPNIEYEEGYANYMAYTLTAGGLYSLNVRVGNTLVFALSDEEHKKDVNDIMYAIGYFEE